MTEAKELYWDQDRYGVSQDLYEDVGNKEDANHIPSQGTFSRKSGREF